MAAREPLRRIVEVCAAFEDAIAGGAETALPSASALSAEVISPAVHLTVAAAMPDDRTLATIVDAAAAIGPCAEAFAKVASALKRFNVAGCDTPESKSQPAPREPGERHEAREGAL
jgi:hypothetical protein